VDREGKRRNGRSCGPEIFRFDRDNRSGNITARMDRSKRSRGIQRPGAVDFLPEPCIELGLREPFDPTPGNRQEVHLFTFRGAETGIPA